MSAADNESPTNADSGFPVAGSGVERCPSCGEATIAGANWCEACGHDLSLQPLPDCAACGEPQVGADGYCQVCGHRQPVERDHMVESLGPVAAVSDRGLRRHQNEDAFALGRASDGQSGPVVMVVCDGVSTTTGSAAASQAAADAARDHLVSTVDGVSTPDGIQQAIRDAVVAAQAAATGAARAGSDGGDRSDRSNPTPSLQAGWPSTTLVATVTMVADDGPIPTSHVWVGWVGDSRAYVVVDGETTLLTADHQLAGALTRWLGADSENSTPDVRHHEVVGPGWLLVCSDGLWRYLHSATGEPAHELLDRLTADGAAGRNGGLNLAEELIRFANDHGGHDNVTAALFGLNQGVVTTVEERQDG